MLEVILPIAIILAMIFIIILFLFKGLKVVILNLNKEIINKIEMFGYFLLVVLLVWELILKNILMKNFYNIDIYYIKEKLSYIFLAIKDVNNADKLDRIFYLDKKNEFLEKQLLCVDIIEVSLKIISTICIAMGRFFELFRNKKNSLK